MPNAFVGKSQAPTGDELEATLGASARLWSSLLQEIGSVAGPVTQEWKCYSRKAGWTLKVVKGKRTLLYATPGEGRFAVTVVLGDAALAAARAMNLPADIVREIATARRYAEGTPVRVEVTSGGDVRAIAELVKAKLGLLSASATSSQPGTLPKH